MAQWLAKKGRKLDDEDLEEPDPIYPDLIPLWHAWHELSLSRPVGMALGALPWSELSRFCEDHGVEGALRLRWIRLLRAMDSTYMRWQAEDRKRRGGR